MRKRSTTSSRVVIDSHSRRVTQGGTDLLGPEALVCGAPLCHASESVALVPRELEVDAPEPDHLDVDDQNDRGSAPARIDETAGTSPR